MSKMIHQQQNKINDLQVKIADLEAKLAESEKSFIIANNLRKNSNEVLLNYKTEKYGLDKTIQELRKIKLSFPEKEWYYKGFENCERQMSSHIADLTLEVKELKQQLAEKEKQLENAQNLKAIEVADELSLKLSKIHNQDKISFAVEVLKIAQDYVQQYVNDFDDMNDCICAIDKLIKQLTHQHEDKGAEIV